MNSNDKTVMNTINRRKFFQSAASVVATTCAVPTIVPSSVLGAFAPCAGIPTANRSWAIQRPAGCSVVPCGRTGKSVRVMETHW